MTGGTRSYEMARRLVTWGHEVHIVTSARNSKQLSIKGWRQTEEAGIKVHWLPVAYSNQMSYRERIWAFTRFSVAAIRKTISLKGDIIFATSTPLTIALPAVLAKRRNRIPMVFEVRDLWPELPIAIGALRSVPLIAIAKWLERFAYANSEQMKEGIIRAGYPAERIHVIPNSADLELFGSVKSISGERFRDANPWLGSRPLVLYAGTLGRINGVSYFVKLAAEVQKLDSDIRFLVVGTGQEEDKVRKLADKLHVSGKNFFMIPAVAKKDMPMILSATTVATSLFIDLKEMWANSANKFFDALASSTPVAINYGGWQAEILQTSGAGIVLPPKDVITAANLLIEKIKNAQWLIKASQAAGAIAAEQFDRDKLAVRLEKVLVQAAAAKH